MPYVDASNISGYFPTTTPKEAIDLMIGLLDYDPAKRLSATQALAHPFFDELRDPNTRLPDGSKLPDSLFEFTEEELAHMKKIGRGQDLIR